MSELRARIALALAARTHGSKRKPYLAIVERTARLLDKKPIPWCGALANLLRAQVAALVADSERERTLLVESHAGFELSELAGYDTVTQLRLGALVGGAAKDHLTLVQTTAHEAGVANLAGMTRML